ncbi:unnamed protein product [Paramecium pentaurelia]|uniref:Uncharacterized protein n=1 Tax=Paramecium pentaurelia TaxID=43138 RepID=A0A8S1UBM1_9CILI|nr:unnamed protein product [Paramecium pentaurelia]
MNRTPHMDQLISKIYRQRKNQTPNDYSREMYSHPNSHQTSNKDLLNLTSKQKLNKSCNYNSNLHQRLQSKAGADIKQKLLDEILRGSHSNISTSYLISTLKEKVSEKVNQKVQKYNTCQEASSFTIPEKELSPKPMFKILENFLFAECQNLKNQVSLNSFQELLDKMEIKEQSLKISIFADLKKLFIILAQSIRNDIQTQKKEIESLLRQNNSFKSQIQEMNSQLDKFKSVIEDQQKQIKIKNEENFISIMNTLRSHGVDPRKMLKKCQDNVETCKLKQEQSEFIDESQKYSSDDSIPFVDPQTIIKNEKKVIGLALNLNPLKDPKKAPIGYQDEFMANINEFSESWRQQALAEKRF